jgi:hypothetical protein
MSSWCWQGQLYFFTCSILWHSALLSQHHTHVLVCSKIQWGCCFSIISCYKFCVGPCVYCCWYGTLTYPLNTMWLMGYCTICCMLLLLQLLLPFKKINAWLTQVTGWGTLLKLPDIFMVCWHYFSYYSEMTEKPSESEQSSICWCSACGMFFKNSREVNQHTCTSVVVNPSSAHLV